MADTSNILMTPDQMEDTAKQYERRGSDVDQLTKELDGMLTTLVGEWHGQASQSFEDRWTNDLKKSFVSAADMLRQIASALRNASSSFQESDKSIAGTFK